MLKRSKENQTVWFLIKLMLLCILWNWAVPDSVGGNVVTLQLAHAGAWALKLVGLPSHVQDTTIWLQGAPLLVVGPSCNGVDFCGLFACFVIAFPAAFKHKIWFLPLGILSIHVLNTMRVILLCFNFQYSRASFDFNHKYTFVVIVYGVMFALWMTWAKKYAVNLLPVKPPAHG